MEGSVERFRKLIEGLGERFRRIFESDGLWNKATQKAMAVLLSASALLSPQISKANSINQYEQARNTLSAVSSNENLIKQLVSYASSVKMTEEQEALLDKALKGFSSKGLRPWNDLSRPEREQIKSGIYDFLTRGRDLQNVDVIRAKAKELITKFIEDEEAKEFCRRYVFIIMDRTRWGYKKLKNAQLSFDDIPQVIKADEVPKYVKLVVDRLNSVTGLNVEVEVRKHAKYNPEDNSENKLIEGYTTLHIAPFSSYSMEISLSYREDRDFLSKEEVLSLVFHEYGHVLSFGYDIVTAIYAAYVMQADFLTEKEKKALIDRLLLVKEKVADAFGVELSAKAGINYSLCPLMDPQNPMQLHPQINLPLNKERFEKYCAPSKQNQGFDDYLSDHIKNNYPCSKYLNMEGGIFASISFNKSKDKTRGLSR